MRKVLMTVTALLCLLAAEVGASAAAFVKFEGVKGEATDRAHEGWIEVLSVSHTMHKPGTGSSAAPRRGDVVLEDISITKTADKVSPMLAEAACKGKVFPKVEIHVTASYSDAGRVTYYKYELTNVYVTSYQVAAGGSDEIPVEEIALNFTSIKVD